MSKANYSTAIKVIGYQLFILLIAVISPYNREASVESNVRRDTRPAFYSLISASVKLSR